jgi:hypothetical protein
MGQRGGTADPATEKLADEAIARCLSLARPRHVYRSFAPIFDDDAGEIRLPDAALTLTGGGIRRNLGGAERVIVMAATLGSEAERAITAAQHEGMSMALAMDAAATACIEAVCDEVCEEIAVAAAKEGLSTGNRFSPGYGDLPLALQPAILATLDAGRKIGLTCTDTLIMLPRKSVTAFVWLFRKECGEEKRDCVSCDLRDGCAFRRGL